MLFSLILGFIIGGLSVIFALQNVAVVTVSFLSWQITASLAFILLSTLLCGILITLLVLLPSAMRDEGRIATLKSEKDDLERELAIYRTSRTSEAEPATVRIIPVE